MQKNILIFTIFLAMFALMGCNNDKKEIINYTKVDEKYKTIIIPIVKQSDILYTPVDGKYKSITIPIIKENDLR